MAAGQHEQRRGAPIARRRSRIFVALAGLLAAGAWPGGGPAEAQNASVHLAPAPPIACDRRCLIGIADRVLASMTRHDAAAIPLARFYAYTENGGPSAPGLSSLWRSVTQVVRSESDPYMVDPETGQVFMVFEVHEGAQPAALWGRLKVVDRRITEMELYLGRARAEAGAQFGPDGLNHLPAAWGASVAPDARPGRAELERVAHAIFDPQIGPFRQGDDCELVENGVVVLGDAKGVQALEPWSTKAHAPHVVTLADGRTGVPFPCDLNPKRPTDLAARIMVDTERGVAIAFATVPGVIYPQFFQAGDGSAFVPAELASLMMNAPAEQRDPNPTGLDPRRQAYTPVTRPVPAVENVVELWKFTGGEVQGTHRLMQLQPVGSLSPWVALQDQR
jgi:hypothetical protein